MEVKHLRVQNFTSLIDVDLRDLPDFVVFIGKNSSGKSNIIDALALLFMEFGTEIDRDMGTRDNFQHLFPNHNTQVSQTPEISATVALTFAEWSSLIDTTGYDKNDTEEFELRLTKRLVAADDNIRWQTSEVSFDVAEVVINGQIVTDDAAYVEPNDFLERLGSFLNSIFQVIYTTERPRFWPSRFEERPTIIDAEHVGDLWRLSQSKGNQRQSWTRAAQQYRKIAPNEQRPEGVASSIQMEEGTLSVPIGMTGEGSQAVLRLISKLERGSAIMAIEEPETHLHPTLIKQVGQLLTETTTRNKQLFVSTHSPFLIDPSSLDSFFVVRKGSNGTQVSPMRDNSDLRNLLLDIGIRPSDILFCDAILLVEGLADEIFFNALSNKIGAPLGGRHVKIVPANGASRGKYKVEFWAEVGRDAGIPLYLVLDSNAREEAETAISNGRIPSDRLLILGEGDLEDCYPWRALKEALSTRFNKEIEDQIPVGGRVKELREMFRRQWSRNGWKPILAEQVAQVMTREEADSEMGAIVGFLRKIYHEVGAE